MFVTLVRLVRILSFVWLVMLLRLSTLVMSSDP